MGKSRRGHKERSREQELKYENQKLRREVQSLRKQLARLDLDRHSYVKDIIEEHMAQEDQVYNTEDVLRSMKNEWKCNNCHEGYLEIFLYNKLDQTWYYRQCNNCDNRTKSQIYNPEKVLGIIKNPEKKST